MGMKYFQCYYDNEKAIDRLSDAQAGRLFKALMDYACRGEESPLGAREQGIFDLMSLQIGRDQEKYDKMCAAQAARARKRWNRGDDAAACSGCQEEDKDENKDEDQEEYENKEKEENEDKEEYLSYSAEPSFDASAPQVIALPLNTGEDFSVTEDMLREWESLYPGIDVMQALRNMRGWLMGNRNRRKTRRGILRFVHGWLAKSQDEAVRPGYRDRRGDNASFMDIYREMEDAAHEPPDRQVVTVEEGGLPFLFGYPGV